MSTDKTLADVQPGGRVRLGDQAERARFEAWPQAREFEIQKDGSGEYLSEVTHGAWLAWKYLSAQPRPGGQDGPAYEGHTWVSDYVLAALRERAAMPLQLRNGEVWHWQGDGHDFPESLVCPVIMSAETLRALLAARQPVGEPVGRVRTRVDGGFIAELLPGVADRLSNMAPLYLHQPAQAVDLGQFRDSVVQAISNVSYMTGYGPAYEKLTELLALIDSQAVGNGN